MSRKASIFYRNPPDIRTSHEIRSRHIQPLQPRRSPRPAQRALAEDGVDPAHWSIEALAPYDHSMAAVSKRRWKSPTGFAIAAGDHILDIGSGIGGPARYFAHRFGCAVTGIDLTPEFCDVARELTRALGLGGRVRFEVGNALAMPFADGSFDGAYSMNVSMNIADKGGALSRNSPRAEAGRLADAVRDREGPGGDPDYPTPWAAQRAAPASCRRRRKRGADSWPPGSTSSTAQHARKGAGVWRPLPRDGRARRKAAASRGPADSRRHRNGGHGEYGARSRGVAHRSHRSPGQESACRKLLAGWPSAREALGGALACLRRDFFAISRRRARFE